MDVLVSYLVLEVSVFKFKECLRNNNANALTCRHSCVRSIQTFKINCCFCRYMCVGVCVCGCNLANMQIENNKTYVNN